ncbi:YncE family protein [Alkaliphilus serpentinus]|uniref:YncE family protein n=1 Tax=Alkaliphilus serpentinus TaxID=1482731 RepID=A0A833HNS5_9FIRM|nr:YncE family protein [Alkaliphilus serpentinus]KAB3529872.1 YncE family protein [Alkaliphilus serpentinus]
MDLYSGVIIISNYYDDSISIVDTKEGKEIKRISLIKDNLLYPPAHFGPHHIAVEGNTKFLYVPNTYHNSLAIIDLITGKLTDILYVGSCPSQVVLCKKYNLIYVANSDSNSVSVIQMDSLKMILQIPTGQMPHGMVLSKDQERLFVANQGSKTITEIITEKNIKRKCYSVDGNPWHLKLSSDGKLLFAVHYSHLYQRKGKIFVYRVEDMELMNTIAIGKMPVEVACDKINERLYISDSDMDVLHVYNLQANKAEEPINVGKMPHGLEMDYEKEEIYVTGIHSNTLHVVDFKNKTIKKTISVGKEPTSIVII